MRILFFCPLLLFAPVLVSSEARADEIRQLRPSSLSWVRRAGAESCPGSRDMARTIERRLHREVFVPATRAELAVEALVEPGQGSGFHVLITTSGADGAVLGQRELSTQESSCAPIAESAALAIALMIDPEATLGPEKPPEPPPAPPPVTTAPVVPPPPEPSQGLLELATGLYAGLLPNVTPGFSIRAFVVPRATKLAIELGGTYFLQQSVAVGSPSKATFSLAVAEAGLCTAPPNRAVALWGCAGAELGRLGAAGSNLPNEQHYQRWFVDLDARGTVSLRPAESWLFSLTLAVVFPLVRDTFSVGVPAREVFDMPAVAGGAYFGVGHSF
jgi:hypothetical protein